MAASGRVVFVMVSVLDVSGQKGVAEVDSTMFLDCIAFVDRMVFVDSAMLE
jgi:hypothetical protein